MASFYARDRCKSKADSVKLWLQPYAIAARNLWWGIERGSWHQAQSFAHFEMAISISSGDEAIAPSSSVGRMILC